MGEARVRLKLGRFHDYYRGDGVFASVPFGTSFLTISLRWRWHFYTIVPASKPHVRRVYIGPLEVEYPRSRPAAKDEA